MPEYRLDRCSAALAQVPRRYLGGEPNEVCPDGPEYNGCPNFLILDHFFEFAQNPVFPPVADTEMHTTLVLVPCTQDLLLQQPGSAVVQYLVYNEFEQRFSTSRAVFCKFESFLSFIDTTQPEEVEDLVDRAVEAAARIEQCFLEGTDAEGTG